MGNTCLLEWLQPFRSFNSYGLFRVMTMTRPEIIIRRRQRRKNVVALRIQIQTGRSETSPGLRRPASTAA